MQTYTQIRVSTLRGDRKIPFNAFVQVAGKYILYCREGESFEGPRLERLKTKKLAKMYVPDEQMPKYSSYVQENIDSVYKNSADKSVEVRTQIAQGLLQSDAESLIEDLSNLDQYTTLTDSIKRFTSFFFSEKDALHHLLAIPNADHNLIHHGVVVAALSMVIMQELTMTESQPSMMIPVFLGALFHDVEHHFNNINLLVRPTELTKPERKLYLRHSLEGAKRLEDLKQFPNVAIDIVRCHEEKTNGSGPLGFKEQELNIFSLMVAVANVFDHLLTYEALLPKEALKRLLIENMGQLSLDSMKALQSGLKKRAVL